MTRKTSGSRSAPALVSLQDVLERDGVREETLLRAFKRVVALGLEQEMQEQSLSKAEMARRMGTSRAQLDRVLDPDAGNVTLDTVARAAQSLGKRLQLELV